MKCYNCGTVLRNDAKFCDECGEKQGPSRRPIFSDKEISEIRARAEPEEYVVRLRNIVEEGLRVERRHAAVLFVDVSDFTSLTSSLSPDQLRDVMRDVYAAMSEAIAKCGGYVDKFLGDEVMALFGAPISLERPSDRAITAADEIAIGLVGVNHRFKDLLPSPLSIHAGIAFGEVQAGRLGDSTKLEYAVLGETINVAKRLTDAAPSGTVFVSKRIEDRARERFEFGTLGMQQLPGLKQPMEVFRLLGPRKAAGDQPQFSRFGSPMFGRDQELRELKEAFQKLRTCYPGPRPCRIGEGRYREFSQVLSISGEAGIGKSRLRKEFHGWLRGEFGEAGFRWLVGSAWSIGQTPLYWPIKMQIASALDFDLSSASEVIATSLSGLRQGEIDDRELIPYLYHLYGVQHEESPLSMLAPKAIRDNLWIAIRRLFSRWAFEKPLVLVFENVHWSDGGTIDFLGYLAGFLSDFPVTLLVVSRTPFKLELGKRGEVSFTEIRLSPLRRDAQRQLLEHYVRPGVRDEKLIRKIMQFSDGNPLFIEEFLHLLLEEGKLQMCNGKMCLTEDVTQMSVPAGVSAVLGERFDRLERRHKRVAYYAAVIGHSFLCSLLCDVHRSLHDAGEIKDCLDTLTQREIILQKAIKPELEYVFKHALGREMLVSRLVRGLRRELSKLVATRVETLYSDRIDEFHGMLSDHWEVAGETRKAARHAALSGMYDRRQQRNFEACAAFERYQRLSEGLHPPPLSPEEDADVLLSRINLLTVLGSYEDAMGLCRVLSQVCDGGRKAVALFKEAYLKFLMGDSARSIALAQQALFEAKGSLDLDTQAGALNVLGIVHGDQGHSERALQCLQESLSIKRELADQQGIANSLNNISIVHRGRGEYSRALEDAQESLATFRQLGDHHGIANSLITMGLLHTYCGRWQEALRCYRESLETMRELGNRHSIATLLNNIGIVHHLGADYDNALKYYSESLEIMQELGDRSSIVLFLSNMGSAHADKGAFQRALEIGTEAEQLARSIGDRLHLIESLAILCRANAGTGSFSLALTFGNEALSISAEIHNQEYGFVARQAVAEAHLHMVRWHCTQGEGEKPPLSKDDALRKAVELADEAKRLAESKGMGGYIARAEKLLAEIEECKR